jgi:hypothetical protein
MIINVQVTKENPSATDFLLLLLFEGALSIS